MSNLRPASPRTPSTHSFFVSKDLSSTTHVFIRHDAVRKPLQHPYDSPFKVLQRNDKYFTVDMNGRQDTVSIDRLKVAHLDTPSTVVVPAHIDTPVTPTPILSIIPTSPPLATT